MNRMGKLTTLVTAVVLVMSLAAFAHYQLILPSDDFLADGDSRDLLIQLIFTHPTGAIHADDSGHHAGGEGDPTSMDMAAPVEFGVVNKGNRINLTDQLEAFKFEHGDISVDAYQIEYRARGLGDFIFYLAPGPYFDPIEDGYITQYSKTIVNAGGLPTDWNEPVGLKAEILPLTAPSPLWVGNVFTGVVLMDGEPVPYAEIEVEFVNSTPFKGALPSVAAQDLPGGEFPGQQIITDANGVFSYSFPWSGWWGFVALLEGPDYMGMGQEIGACLTFKVYDINELP